VAKTIVVVAEGKRGGLRKTALETLAAGRMIADKTGGALAAVLVGNGLDAAAAKLAEHGVVVHAIDDASYARYSPEAFTEALTRLAKEKGVSHVLFADTSMGKDLAPAVAVRLDAALATDVVSIEVQPDGYLKVVHPIYTGKVNADFVLQRKPVQVVSVRPNIFAPAGAASGGCVEKLAWPVGTPPRAVVKEVVATSGGRVELGEAERIVSGGRSLKSAENFA